MNSLQPDPPPWPIVSAKWRKLSLVLTALAEIELLAAAVGSLLRGQLIWGVLLLPVGWIIFYGITFALASAIGKLNPNDPSVANYPKMPGQILTCDSHNWARKSR